MKIVLSTVTIMDTIFKNITVTKLGFFNFYFDDFTIFFTEKINVTNLFSIIRCTFDNFKLNSSKSVNIASQNAFFISSTAKDQNYNIFDVEIKNFYSLDINYPISGIFILLNSYFFFNIIIT